MAKIHTPIQIDIDTFAGHVNKTNQLISDMATITITTDADGSSGVTSGNAHVSGRFSADTLYGVQLSGGNNTVSSTLTVVSNTSFTGSLISISAANTYITGDLNLIDPTKTVKVDYLDVNVKAANNITFQVPKLSANVAANTNITSPNMNITSSVFVGALDNTTFNTTTTAFTANTFNVTANTVSISGNTTFSNLIAGSINGNANTANKWTNARTISLTGGATGNVSVDGSANAAINVTITNNSHSHTIANVTNLQTELDNRLTLAGKAADSDLLDGLNSTAFVRSDVDAQKTGKLQMMGTNPLAFGDSSEYDLLYFAPSSTAYIRTAGTSIFMYRLQDGTTPHRFYMSGDYIASGEIFAHSDARLKTDVSTITDALDKVKSLRGVSYTKDNKKSVGVIAQEVLEVIPEVVREYDDYYSVCYGNLVGVLIEAVKELSIEVEELKRKTRGK